MFDTQNGQWHMFHGLGAVVWDAITLRGGTDGLAEELAIPAGLDLAATREALDQYLDELRQMGLLTSTTEHRRRRRGWWRR
ncbi:hypothetical protein [Streptomyces noursei]|uniref:hypothetical protein n=1 Tax=Streptomyces noursei TaxID=1971 RepID=UPI00381F8496